MATYNSWLTQNLASRLNDSTAVNVVNMSPYTFNEMDFHSAADFTAKKIAEKYNKIFLSFSGGADSDYVFHCLVRNNIDFTPIIVQTSGNKTELEYAYHSCRKYKKEPVILRLEDHKLLKLFQQKVITKLKGKGLCAIPGIIACEYAKDNNGILIMGEHMIDNDGNRLFPGMNEWDFYNEVFVGEDYTVPFFNYTIELFYAMVKRIESLPICEWKHQLYGIGFRPIIEYQFDYKFQTIYRSLMTKIDQTISEKFNLDSKEDLLSSLDKYKK